MTKSKTKELALTANQLKEQGQRLTDAMTRVAMVKHFSNTLMIAMISEADRAILLSCLDNFLSQTYDQMDSLYKELDNIAYSLLECDNPEELKAYKERG